MLTLNWQERMCELLFADDLCLTSEAMERLWNEVKMEGGF